ncbi:MAG: hypothetical protein GWO08_04780 [Gammaproteobacteria bacterium]|nr:hypothetical protein [Gammaproteobacteria bacterium]NIN62600.1 hypothetical protein [Gammaproteobacteria bacterium]NIO63144.1 hypothetical protein [Gammaproteobacteria bacterium]NIP48984.1 hypothetical protein [Gammaproteobacteria bacterium]NIQ09439.1 hypothetical protein [Gammaproteobacteria bacterium]
MKNNRLRIFRLTCLTITTTSLLMISIPEVTAAEMSQGEMAGIIRSSGNPCNKVLDLMDTSDNSWTVQCNSGKFVVKRDAEGQYSVEPVE